MGDRKKIPLPSSLFELIIVCVNISHPGNLGAISRTMLNYGFDKLRLVNPNVAQMILKQEIERSMLA